MPSIETPRNAVTGILDDPANVTAVEAAMASVDTGELHLFSGEDAKDMVDPSGQKHGVKGRLVRLTQKLGEEGAMHDTAMEALEAGKTLVLVQTDKEHRHDIAAVLRDAGVGGIRWWGGGVIEEL
ncbi:hypothetical protein [Euzebya tangerina]|uniref:hypothetical protein n=1 Tax=Euzebya tangerina TaxID=591198 RepID=UPI000E319B84|nr:hypothetical protein [Euzebya tangerina]